MAKLILSTERCKACYLCVANCPKEALSPSGKVNSKGNEYVQVDEEKCVCCGSCYQICPDYVFEIIE